ncbi:MULTISPECIES: hypothetical protein [Dietzia]|uniref:Uncharacterized protein n=1 Tax=Dietzia cinnamea TaxID=321318 RepID=A0ABV3YM47_9ACTN|nr:MULTISPECIES: hypothetical protein [Dietzia]MBM7231831.1 hypothetical protein [Dietzia cinnamea]MCT1639394.1 hypothetical protein [Dietzia cinnamea]MCT1713428.1 hypothetical protein [Dietzia cinnamea]MCT1865297.1 hypothetical protein [Dietzia cinnamea]MCT2031301.1 hypothetical protein [Dietzia cinnamea]
MEDVGRVVIVTAAIMCVLIGAVGWSARGWAWAALRAKPRRDVLRVAEAGSALALACGVGLVLLSWTSLLDLGEALLGAVAWATVYVSTIGAKQALDKMA